MARPWVVRLASHSFVLLALLLLALFLPALLLPTSMASAQEAGEEAAAEVVDNAPIEPLLPREIGSRIEETFAELQAVTPRLRRKRDILAIGDALPSFVHEVDALRDQPVLDHLDSLSPRRLVDLANEWERLLDWLQSWQATLETRSSALTEERDHVARSKRLWRITLNAEREEPLPSSQVERIRSLRDRIRSVRQRISRRLEEVLDLQGELSDEGFRIAAIVARIDSARRRAREERESADHEPLWTGGVALEGARPEPELDEVWREHRDSLASFVARDSSRIVSHTLAFFLMLAFLLWLRWKFGTYRPSPSHATPLRALRSRPIACAALLVLLATPVVYPYVPALVSGLTLATLVPAVIRLNPFLFPSSGRTIVALMVLSGLAALASLDYAPAPIRRVLILILSLAGAVVAGWMSRRAERSRIAEADRHRQRLHLMLRFAALPLVGAAYFCVIGLVERAALWMVGTYTVALVAVAIVFAFELVGALAAIGARHRYAHMLRTLKHFRRSTVAGIVLFTRVVGGIALGYLALESFDVRDPLLEELRLTLREEYEFGSIVLSLGDLLSFTAVMAGTFVVVRAVHLILQRELLPRLQLGPGTESVISLTASYLLVALGVVLAFGTAGVDPEQLALLGGALGVGIGFGLQNIVSNFVAGLILVAERPIKVGDVVEIGDLVGEVTRIGLRSSTVRSLKGADVIVPNAELISGQLVNWTHTDALRRVDLAIGTAYRHDPAAVKKILDRVVRQTPGVLYDPKPEVIVTGFGESSIDFEIRTWIADYLEQPRFQSKLAQRVYKALDEAGIEIPFPQHDVRVLEAAHQGEGQSGHQ